MIKFAAGHPGRVVEQHLHRLIDEFLGHQGQAKGEQQQQDEGQDDDVVAIGGGLHLHPLERDDYVEHSENLCLAGMEVAFGGVAGRLIVDPLGDPEHVLAGAVLKDAAAVHGRRMGEGRILDVAHAAGLGLFVKVGADFGLFGGKADRAVFVDQANVLDAMLRANLFDHLVDPLAVILEHLIMGGPDDGLAQFVDIVNGLAQKYVFEGFDVDHREKDHGQQQNRAGADGVFGDEIRPHDLPPSLAGGFNHDNIPF